jgi:hypothetical protein
VMNAVGYNVNIHIAVRYLRGVRTISGALGAEVLGPSLLRRAEIVPKNRSGRVNPEVRDERRAAASFAAMR